MLEQGQHISLELFICETSFLICFKISCQRTPEIFSDLQLLHSLEITIGKAPADFLLSDSTITILIKYVESHPEMLVV